MNILGVRIEIQKASAASTRNRWTRRGVALTTAGALMIGGGIAYAFWSTSATGSGSAASGAPSNLVITGSAASGLVPGGTAPVVFVITNNNKANVSLTALTLTNTGIAGFTDSTFLTPKSACSTTGVTWTTTSKTLTTPIVIAAGASYTLTLNGMASMDTTSDNGCQSTTFQMPVSAGTATLVATAATSPSSGTQ